MLGSLFLLAFALLSWLLFDVVVVLLLSRALLHAPGCACSPGDFPGRTRLPGDVAVFLQHFPSLFLAAPRLSAIIVHKVVSFPRTFAIC